MEKMEKERSACPSLRWSDEVGDLLWLEEICEGEIGGSRWTLEKSIGRGEVIAAIIAGDALTLH